MGDYRSIIISKGSGKVKIQKNPTSYKLIGKGCQGAVFKLSSKRCVKVYANYKHKLREEKVLTMTKNSSFFPNLYEAGTHYLVMEYIKGITLEQFLKQEQQLPIAITQQIIFLIKEMKHLNVPLRDPKLRHMILTKNNKIKLIDHVNSLKSEKHKPKVLFKELKKLGLLVSFLKQLKELDSKMYNEWKQLMKKDFK